MAAARTVIAMKSASHDAPGGCYRPICAGCPKPGLGRDVFTSLLMCFPLTCMLWAAIIYGAVKLVR